MVRLWVVIALGLGLVSHRGSCRRVEDGLLSTLGDDSSEIDAITRACAVYCYGDLLDAVQVCACVRVCSWRGSWVLSVRVLCVHVSMLVGMTVMRVRVCVCVCVQMNELFDDSKYFVDMPMLEDPETILNAFADAGLNAQSSTDDLNTFVSTYFR